jgi:hypothetical protein
LRETDIRPHYGGTFYDFKKGKIFYALSNGDKCVTLTLEGFAYDKVIVEVQDKEETAAMIRKALASPRKQVAFACSKYGTTHFCGICLKAFQ